MFSDQVTKAVVAAANANHIEPATLLALVEIETSGKVFENDGRTPQLLYERHIAFREAGKVSRELQAQFVAAGLAQQGWQKATQYQDERTSAQRLDLIRRATKIDEEVALRSCSWGIGQTMGFLAPELGFDTARQMVDHMTGSLDGQVDCMVREVLHSHLVDPLNSHDWPYVARIYNGAGYRANRYDERLADAYKRWVRRLENPPTASPEQDLSEDEVRAIQQRLRDLGYYEVGAVDGAWGSRTTGALSAFQSHEGLAVSGHYDHLTRVALNAAAPRPIPEARQTTTADELKEAGSKTVTHSENLSLWGRVMKWLGIGGAGAAGADSAGLIDGAKEWLGGDVKGALDTLGTVANWAVAHWWIAALGLGAVVAYRADAIVRARLEDHVSGRHAGPENA
jgi:hypothetical protein